MKWYQHIENDLLIMTNQSKVTGVNVNLGILM